MATTQNTYTGDNSTVSYSFTFPYLEETDIKVSLDGVVTTAYTLSNATTVTFNTAPGSGVAIRIYRDTNNDALAATFFAGSAIRAQDLNDDFLQNAYVTQEVKDRYLDRLAGGTVNGNVAINGTLDMNGNRIIDMADPTSDQDAATKFYIDTRLGDIGIPGHTRWRKTATASQTTFSGTGDYGGTLAYTATREQVYLNGALQQRGVDYTADDGDEIVFSVALTAGDIVDIVCVNNLTNSDLVLISDANVDNNAGIVATKLSFTQSGTGATARTVDSKLKDVVSVKDFGAVGDGTTDDTSAIQAAIDAANASGARTVVSLGGDSYLVADELFIKTNVVLKDGTIIFQPTAGTKTAINIGTRTGSYLVRVGGVENVVVDASGSTQDDITGFNMGHVARACFVSKCRAIMNNGLPPTTDRNHIGFSIQGVRPDLATSAGAYQNTFDSCSAYACRTAYYLDTDGFGETGWAPESNGNFITNCAAYSCYTSAVYLGEGAQENHVQVRADTFGSQIGQGTTIKVVDVKGSFNSVEVAEEIGARADTQYTAYVSGSNARYNTIKYSTQQVVTAAYEDATTGSSVGKNVGINITRSQDIGGSDTFTVSGYASISASSTSSISGFVAPCPCVLIRASARAAYSPTSYTRFYFAKSGSIDTLQRLTWSSSDAAGTVKTKFNDPTSAGTIDSRFIYAAGEFCDVSVHQDASAGQILHYTLVFKALSPA